MNSSKFTTRVNEKIGPSVCETIRSMPDVDSCYATGSIVAGLGTSTSDIDLIVLARDSQAKLNFNDTLQGLVQAPRLDVEIYSRDEFGEFIECCSRYDVTAGRSDRLYRIVHPLKILRQLSSGCHVIKDSPAFQAFHSRIIRIRPMLRRLALAQAVVFGANTQEDLLGFLADGDPIGSLRRSHDLLEFGLDALCIARDQLYPDERMKWLWRRLLMTGLDDARLAWLERLYVPETSPADDLLPWRRLDVSQGLLAEAMVACWSPSNALTLSTPGVVDHQASNRLWRSPQWYLTRTDDEWLLACADDAYSVPITSAYAWARASSSTREALARDVVEGLVIAGTELRRDTASRVIGAMEKMGALVHSDTFDGGR